MVKIIYEDNHIIVAVKPPNMLSQADKTRDLDILTDLKEYIRVKYAKPGNVYLGLVHRLDRPVGGLMVFARTSKAASRLSAQMREHDAGREYLCVAEGTPRDRFKLINYLIENERLGRVVVCDADERGGKQAILQGDAAGGIKGILGCTENITGSVGPGDCTVVIRFIQVGELCGIIPAGLFLVQHQPEQENCHLFSGYLIFRGKFVFACPLDYSDVGQHVNLCPCKAHIVNI